MNIVMRLKELVGEERRVAAEIVRLLLQVENEKIFAPLGYPSIYEFCRQELDYSDGAAYRRISAMRLQKRDPRCAGKIENGELSLSNAAKLETALRQAEKQNIEVNETELFDSMLGATSRQADKLLEKVLPQEKRAQLPTSLEEKIEKLRTLLAHHDQAKTREEILHLILDEAIAERAPKDGNLAGEVKSPRKRHIPKKIRDGIFDRDNHCCTFVSKEGKKCTATEFLEIDHIKPFALGGKTVPENLRLLCRIHNQQAAEEHGLAADAA